MSAPKYSILIPTRNGAKYLPFAIKTVLGQSFEDFELIVSVNHSQDNTLELLDTLNDKRLNVIIPPSELSMTKHYEYILSKATGEWITILGDDDGLMPYFFREVEAITKENPGIEAIASRRAYYFWDNSNVSFGSAAKVSFSMSKRKSLKLSTLEMIATLLDIQTFFELPQLYTTGLIKRDLVQNIKNRSGNLFYHSMIPDAYSAAAILLGVNKYLRTEMPLSWVGTSPKSNGYAFANTKGLNEKVEQEETTTLKQREIVYDFLTLANRDHLTVNKRVSQKMLFSELANNLYLYESLVSCPFAKKIWKSKMVAYFTYAATLVTVLKKKRIDGSSGQEKLELFFHEFKQLDLHLAFLCLALIPVLVYKGVWKIVVLSELLYAKLLSIFTPGKYKKVKFKSSDADLFPDITAASEKALEAYESAFG